jgi:ferredoxin
MRIIIDGDRCIGAGQCQMTAPHVFSGDDDGFSTLLPGHEAHAAEPIVREAERACPVQAITISRTEGADSP